MFCNLLLFCYLIKANYQLQVGKKTQSVTPTHTTGFNKAIYLSFESQLFSLDRVQVTYIYFHQIGPSGPIQSSSRNVRMFVKIPKNHESSKNHFFPKKITNFRKKIK